MEKKYINVYILDKTTFEVTGIVDEYISITWNDNYYESGTFTFDMIAEQKYIDMFVQGNYIYTKETDSYMVIEKVTIQSDLNDVDKLEVSGRSVETILDRRVIANKYDSPGEKIDLKFDSTATGVGSITDGKYLKYIGNSKKISEMEVAKQDTCYAYVGSFDTNDNLAIVSDNDMNYSKDLLTYFNVWGNQYDMWKNLSEYKQGDIVQYNSGGGAAYPKDIYRCVKDIPSGGGKVPGTSSGDGYWVKIGKQIAQADKNKLYNELLPTTPTIIPGYKIDETTLNELNPIEINMVYGEYINYHGNSVISFDDIKVSNKFSCRSDPIKITFGKYYNFPNYDFRVRLLVDLSTYGYGFYSISKELSGFSKDSMAWNQFGSPSEFFQKGNGIKIPKLSKTELDTISNNCRTSLHDTNINVTEDMLRIAISIPENLNGIVRYNQTLPTTGVSGKFYLDSRADYPTDTYPIKMWYSSVGSFQDIIYTVGANSYHFPGFGIDIAMQKCKKINVKSYSSLSSLKSDASNLYIRTDNVDNNENKFEIYEVGSNQNIITEYLVDISRDSETPSIYVYNILSYPVIDKPDPFFIKYDTTKIKNNGLVQDDNYVTCLVGKYDYGITSNISYEIFGFDETDKDRIAFIYNPNIENKLANDYELKKLYYLDGNQFVPLASDFSNGEYTFTNLSYKFDEKGNIISNDIILNGNDVTRVYGQNEVKLNTSGVSGKFFIIFSFKVNNLTYTGNVVVNNSDYANTTIMSVKYEFPFTIKLDNSPFNDDIFRFNSAYDPSDGSGTAILNERVSPTAILKGSYGRCIKFYENLSKGNYVININASKAVASNKKLTVLKGLLYNQDLDKLIYEPDTLIHGCNKLVNDNIIEPPNNSFISLVPGTNDESDSSLYYSTLIGGVFAISSDGSSAINVNTIDASNVEIYYKLMNRSDVKDADQTEYSNITSCAYFKVEKGKKYCISISSTKKESFFNTSIYLTTANVGANPPRHGLNRTYSNSHNIVINPIFNDDSSGYSESSSLKVKGISINANSGVNSDFNYYVFEVPNDPSYSYKYCLINLYGGKQDMIDSKLRIYKYIDESRAINNVSYVDESDYSDSRLKGITVDLSFFGENLYESLRSVAEAHDCKLVLDVLPSRGLKFKLYKGTNRGVNAKNLSNVPIVLSENYGDIISGTLTKDSSKYKNTAVFVGANVNFAGIDLSTRGYVTYGNGYKGITNDNTKPNGTPSGLDRREVGIDVNKITALVGALTKSTGAWAQKKMDEKAKEAFTDTKEINKYDGEISKVTSYEYGKDFFLGDIIHVKYNYGHEEDVRITGYTLECTTDGIRSFPTFEKIEEEDDEEY